MRSSRLTLFWFVLVFGALVLSNCYWIEQVHHYRDECIRLEAQISNISEIQEKLKAAGYYRGRVDGKWGPQTERAYCDWVASKYFE